MKMRSSINLLALWLRNLHHLVKIEEGRNEGVKRAKKRKEKHFN